MNDEQPSELLLITLYGLLELVVEATQAITDVTLYEAYFNPHCVVGHIRLEDGLNVEIGLDESMFIPRNQPRWEYVYHELVQRIASHVVQTPIH